MSQREVQIDVRELPPWERHPKIFGILDDLKVGESLRLVNDHDPRPLYYQIMAERPGQFVYDSKEETPREWVAHISRIAVASEAS